MSRFCTISSSCLGFARAFQDVNGTRRAIDAEEIAILDQLRCRDHPDDAGDAKFASDNCRMRQGIAGVRDNAAGESQERTPWRRGRSTHDDVAGGHAVRLIQSEDDACRARDNSRAGELANVEELVQEHGGHSEAPQLPADRSTAAASRHRVRDASEKSER